MSRERILIMAGGTGGHVFPALAVAQQLRAQGVEVVWMGTRKGLESRVVPAAGIYIEWVLVSGLRGKGILRWLLLPFTLAFALLQSLVIIMRQRPHAILGMGGFSAGPGGVVACLLKKPLVIHEQNAVAGLTNRLLSWCASQVLEAFPHTFSERCHARHTGNPVREDIAALAEPDQRLAQHDGPVRLLVIGGSLGAQALNEAVPQALSHIGDRIALDVWHQAGERNIDAAREQYLQAGVSARLEPFIDDMAAAYAWADIVLCRAGALTIAELAAAGVGSILVPFPYAVDDHQTHNAQYLTQTGAAHLLPQSGLSGSSLGTLLEELCGSRETLLGMARAARSCAMPTATADVAAICREAAQ